MKELLEKEYDELLFGILQASGLYHSVAQLAYVLWKRTGQRDHDQLISASLERLHRAGRVDRIENLRREFIYRYRPVPIPQRILEVA